MMSSAMFILLHYFSTPTPPLTEDRGEGIRKQLETNRDEHC